MPLNTLLVKTSSFNSPTPTKNGFFHFIHRSNNTNHPKSSSSTPQKSKQHGNKRLSADVESLFKEDTDKVIKTRQKELDNNSNSSNSSNTGKYIKEGYYDDMFISIRRFLVLPNIII
jgi:hypothetical protein